MQDARQQMQKSGNQGKVPKGQMSQEFSKMAQQQQMIREAMQKLNREQNKDGKNGMGDLNKVIEEMKSTENELVNKRIEEQTLDRQKKILEKMLDAEKAEREEDEDVNREAKAAKEFPPSYKNMLEKFKAQQQSETEWLQKLPPSMNYYYKNKITTYFKLLNSPK
jgi:seryl-tRNA synthetase